MLRTGPTTVSTSLQSKGVRRAGVRVAARHTGCVLLPGLRVYPRVGTARCPDGPCKHPVQGGNTGSIRVVIANKIKDLAKSSDGASNFCPISDVVYAAGLRVVVVLADERRPAASRARLCVIAPRWSLGRSRGKPGCLGFLRAIFELWNRRALDQRRRHRGALDDHDL
jgi:hypothetical protein